MEENPTWQTVTSHLYANLQPNGAVLRQGFCFNRHGQPEHPYLYVEFEKNEFDYEDPFYGHQSSLSMFEMTIDLQSDTCFRDISHPSQLANQTFSPASSNRIGVFSNSLDISVHQVTFGHLDAKDRQIPLRLEYSFTNSDSYGMMNGTLADHRQTCGLIETTIQIEHPVVKAKKEADILIAIRQLDARLYATDKASPTEDINGVSYPGYVRYTVPHQNISQLPEKGKGDQFTNDKTLARKKDNWLSILFKALKR
jgi:hypothetical protein